jgi:hypothetical protein
MGNSWDQPSQQWKYHARMKECLKELLRVLWPNLGYVIARGVRLWKKYCFESYRYDRLRDRFANTQISKRRDVRDLQIR